MNINSALLLLLVIAAYLNLYLAFNKVKRQQQKKTRLPISSKEWREKVEDDNFKSWLSNRERLKGKRKGGINQ